MKLNKNMSKSLYNFYERYQRSEILLPPHQRGDVWSCSKKKKWWDDIEKGGEIPGCITTYNLSGDGRIFINDGANRAIHSIKEYIEKCKSDGKNYKEILYNCNITEQQVEYENIEEAIQHFININLGTTATPYEILRCEFVSGLDDFVNVWEPLFNKIFVLIDNVVNRLGCKKIYKRDKQHKHLRDSLSIFYRFASVNKSKWSPRVAISSLNPDRVQKDGDLEIKVVKLFKYLGSEKIKEKIGSFEKFLDRYQALYTQTWLEEGKSPVTSPSEVHFRWWLTIAIYHRNNDFNWEYFKNFTNALIKQTGGRTSIFYKDDAGKQNNTNATLSKVNNLSTILKALEIKLDEFESLKETRIKEYTNLKPGFVESHVEPFCQVGNGKTVIENACDNLVRSSKPMDEETERKLEELFN